MPVIGFISARSPEEIGEPMSPIGSGTARHLASSAERLRRASDRFRIVLNAPRLCELRVDGSTEFLERPAMIIPDGGHVAIDVIACDRQEHCVEEVLEDNG